MKKAKQFLQNIMLIAESTEKIKAIVDQYEPEYDDDKLTMTMNSRIGADCPLSLVSNGTQLNEVAD